jgi:hypothetical protein
MCRSFRFTRIEDRILQNRPRFAIRNENIGGGKLNSDPASLTESPAVKNPDPTQLLRDGALQPGPAQLLCPRRRPRPWRVIGSQKVGQSFHGPAALPFHNFRVSLEATTTSWTKDAAWPAQQCRSDPVAGAPRQFLTYSQDSPTYSQNCRNTATFSRRASVGGGKWLMRLAA